MWLNYYFEEQVKYNFLLKKGRYDFLSHQGKSTIVLKLRKGDREHFRIVKALRILNYFHPETSSVLGREISNRRGVWEVEVPIESFSWLSYYLKFFLPYLKDKGLKMRSFCNQEGWLFLLREIGELRLKGLYYDYYSWSSMWQVLVKCNMSEGQKKLYFSSIKLSYKK